MQLHPSAQVKVPSDPAHCDSGSRGIVRGVLPSLHPNRNSLAAETVTRTRVLSNVGPATVEHRGQTKGECVWRQREKMGTENSVEAW